jgi:type II secretory pathway component PulM
MTLEDDQDQFDKAFAEIASKPEGDTPAAAVEPAAEPAPAAPAEAVEAPAPAAPAPSAEELQRQVREALHRERSSANRISSFAKENQSLKAAVDEMRRKLDELSAAKAAPTPAPAPAADLEDVLSDAPDLKASVQRLIASEKDPLLKEIEKLRADLQETRGIATHVQQTFEPIAEREIRSQHEQVWKSLDEKFSPTWRDDVKSADFDEFLKSGEHWQKAFESAKTASDSAAVLGAYYVARGIERKPAPAQAASPATNPNTERLRLAAGVAPRGNQRPPVGPAADDFEGNFAEAMKARKRA